MISLEADLPFQGRILEKVHGVLVQPVPRRVAAAVIFIWIANLLDFFLTLHNISLGAIEANPILAPLFHEGRFMTAFVLKNTMTLSGLTLLVALGRKSKGTSIAFAIISMSYLALICYHISHIIMV